VSNTSKHDYQNKLAGFRSCFLKLLVTTSKCLQNLQKFTLQDFNVQEERESH